MEIISLERTTWRGLDAWLLTANRLNIVLSTIGGNIAAIRRNGEKLNPLWEPPWQAADPANVVPSPSGPYGDGPSAKPYACASGHILCLDRFGRPWPGEDRPLHGEALLAPWRLRPPLPDMVEIETFLPIAGLSVRRSFQFDTDTCHVRTRVLNTNHDKREIEWGEHPSVGDPFLAGARFRAGIDRLVNWPDHWPGSRFAGVSPEADLPIAAALSMPSPDSQPCGEVSSGRVVDGWWSAENSEYGRRLTYRWDAKHFPWLAVWTEHRSLLEVPWLGRARARGMEFATKPFPEGKPPPSRSPTYLQRPSICEIGPGESLERWMTIAWEAC
jgi:hypothetical protein